MMLKTAASKAAGEAAPEAYFRKYVEDAGKPRTKLEDVFSIIPEVVMAKSPQLVIKLTRSPIGTPQSHRLVVRSLGLRRLNQTVIRPATSQVHGMIKKVGYLLDVRTQ